MIIKSLKMRKYKSRTILASTLRRGVWVEKDLHWRKTISRRIIIIKK